MRNYLYSAYAHDTTISQFHFCHYVAKYLRDSSSTQFLSSLSKTNYFQYQRTWALILAFEMDEKAALYVL